MDFPDFNIPNQGLVNSINNTELTLFVITK